MKIIADTNIWYNLGQNEELFNKVKDEPLCPNYVNITELSTTPNLLTAGNEVRSAIQKMFCYQQNTIYERPFVHIAKLTNDVDFDIIEDMGSYLEFTSDYANGVEIDQQKTDDFSKWLEQEKSKFAEASDFFNAEADRIKKLIINKKEHKKINSFQLTADFINQCVKNATENKYDMNGLNLEKIELLIRTLDTFFKTVEISTMKIQTNDWNDFAILSYVRPGDLYWTRDDKWIRLIKQAGCENYLYKE